MSLTFQDALAAVEKPVKVLIQALADRQITGDEAIGILEAVAAVPEVEKAAVDVLEDVVKFVGEKVDDLLHRDPAELRAAADRAAKHGHEKHAANLLVRATDIEKAAAE